MSNSIKILVVEDEMLIGAKIALFLTELGYEVTGILPRAEEALLQMESETPDIALLDIQLKGNMDGISLAKILQKDYQVPVIFLTANTDDATFQLAKKAKPYAFLSKPFNKTDLQRALELTISLMAGQPEAEQPDLKQDEHTLYALPDRIFVRYKKKMVKILFEDIFYIEAERNYCRIITKNQTYLLSMPMKHLENKLPIALFQRIHRSYIVNLSHVEEVEETSVVVSAKSLPMSRSLREAFLLRIRMA